MNKLLRRDFLGVLAAAVLPYGSALATDEQAEQAPPSAPNLPRSAQPQSSKGIAAKPAQRIASKKFAGEKAFCYTSFTTKLPFCP